MSWQAAYFADTLWSAERSAGWAISEQQQWKWGEKQGFMEISSFFMYSLKKILIATISRKKKNNADASKYFKKYIKVGERGEGNM